MRQISFGERDELAQVSLGCATAVSAVRRRHDFKLSRGTADTAVAHIRAERSQIGLAKHHDIAETAEKPRIYFCFGVF